MIPSHSSSDVFRSNIIVKKLSTFTGYNFQEPHRHEYFEFFFFYKGGGKHMVDYLEFPIAPYSIHIVGSGQVHKVNRTADSEGYVFLFELDALDAPQEINDFLFEHVCYDIDELSPTYSLDATKHFKTMVDASWECYQSKSGIEQLILKNTIQHLVLACMAQKENTKPVNQMYSQFRVLLQENFRDYKKVKDYAHMLGVTDKYLNQLVKQKTGKSASQVIYKQITLEAKRLLLTGISSKEVAYALNFEDPAHFSKFFKSNTGCNPSEFRNILD